MNENEKNIIEQLDPRLVERVLQLYESMPNAATKESFLKYVLHNQDFILHGNPEEMPGPGLRPKSMPPVL